MAQLSFPVSRAGLEVPVWIGLNGQTTAALVGRKADSDTASSPRAARYGYGRDGRRPGGSAGLAVPVATATSTHTAGGQFKVNLHRVSLGITDPTPPLEPPG